MRSFELLGCSLLKFNNKYHTIDSTALPCTEKHWHIVKSFTVIIYFIINHLREYLKWFENKWGEPIPNALKNFIECCKTNARVYSLLIKHNKHWLFVLTEPLKFPCPRRNTLLQGYSGLTLAPDQEKKLRNTESTYKFQTTFSLVKYSPRTPFYSTGQKLHMYRLFGNVMPSKCLKEKGPPNKCLILKKENSSVIVIVNFTFLRNKEKVD